MKISVASGGFDPLHSGHIQYLKASAKIGDHLVVALNSDDWLIAKKGKNFLPFTERKLILEHMEMVDEVIEFDDDELQKTCCNNKKISKRKDDNLQAIINRYDEYMKHTKPVLDFYSARNNYFEVNGAEKIEVITGKINQILEA